MFNDQQVQATLKNVPDPKLAQMGQNPIAPTTPADIQAEMARRNQMRAGMPPPAAGANPLGAKPIGQAPQDQGVASLDAPNMSSMAAGGIIPSEGPTNIGDWKKHLVAEVGRRKQMAQGGIVQHFKTGDAINPPDAPGVWGGRTQKANQALRDAANAPADPTSLLARMAAAFAQGQRDAAPSVAAGPQDLAPAYAVPQLEGMGTPPATTLKGSPVPSIVTGLPPGAVVASAAPQVTPDDIAGPTPTLTGSTGSAGADIIAASLPSRLVAAQAYIDLAKKNNGPSNATQYEDTLNNMRTHQNDPLTQGILSMVGNMAQPGYDPQGHPLSVWSNIARGMGAGVKSGQETSDLNEANQIKIAAEQLRSAQIEDAANKASTQFATGEAGADARADRALTASQYQATAQLARERMQEAGFTQAQIMETLREGARQKGQMAMFNQQQLATEFKALQANPLFTMGTPVVQQGMINQIRSIYGGLGGATAGASAPTTALPALRIKGQG